jgi:hypothetical protein
MRTYKWKGCERKWAWPILRYYSTIFMKGNNKTRGTGLRRAGARDENRIRDIPNTQQDAKDYCVLIVYFSLAN